MIVTRLLLKDFRNFSGMNMEFNEGLNIFYGQNAQGKTNLLEALYFCATGRSQRTRQDRELILHGRAEAHVQAHVRWDASVERIDVHLKKDEKKGIAVNGLPIRHLGDLFGLLLTVVFSPEDLQLVKAGPAERRKYMDVELCQLSKVYYHHLQQYYKVLKQRNNLLKRITKNKSLADTLPVWDEQLVLYGSKIMAYRIDFIEKICPLADELHRKITNNKESLTLLYKSNVSAEDFAERLRYSLPRDLLAGSTNFGIHKDDLHFLINGTDARIYGSQGQQRTACLSAKLAEIELIREQTGKLPVLLLDDVLSELDEARQSHLMDGVRSAQTFITCTGVEDLVRKLAKRSAVCYRVENGSVRKKESGLL